MADDPKTWRDRFDAFRHWVRMNVPPGVRLILGLFLMACGVVGFLPVVGFWMLPLGVAISMLDIQPVWSWLREKVWDDKE